MEQVARFPLSGASKRLDDQARDGRSGRQAGVSGRASSRHEIGTRSDKTAERVLHAAGGTRTLS